MHVYTYYLETTGISQAHKKKCLGTWLRKYLAWIVYAVMGQTCCRHREGNASQQMRYYMRLQSRERGWH